MHDSQRYRSNASECLLASYEASQPCYGRLNFSMAALWLALAGQDEAIDNLLVVGALPSQPKLTGLFGCLAGLTPHFNNINFQEPLRQRPHPRGGFKGHDHVDIAKR